MIAVYSFTPPQTVPQCLDFLNQEIQNVGKYNYDGKTHYVDHLRDIALKISNFLRDNQQTLLNASRATIPSPVRSVLDLGFKVISERKERLQLYLIAGLSSFAVGFNEAQSHPEITKEINERVGRMLQAARRLKEGLPADPRDPEQSPLMDTFAKRIKSNLPELDGEGRRYTEWSSRLNEGPIPLCLEQLKALKEGRELHEAQNCTTM